MKLLYVPLDRRVLEQLVELAKLEKRRPQEQAAYLLERALRELEQTKEKEAERCKN